MKITLNGREEISSRGMTLADLISSKGINPETVIVEYNCQLIKKEAWGGIVLKENDRLEILRFVGGG